MNIATSLAIIILAALIHSTFQLSISVLTLLSGHSIGKKHSHTRLVHLSTSFVFGVMLMTMLILSSIALFVSKSFSSVPLLFWAMSCGLSVSIGLAVWVFYYRKEQGTSLWLPRGFADYLNKRTKATNMGAESFGLGLTSVVGEILFVIAPMFVAALVLVQLPGNLQLLAILIYTVISTMSLMITWLLIIKRHKLSSIQKWRENNKKFLQFSAGIGLFVLGFSVYVFEIMNQAVGMS